MTRAPNGLGRTGKALYTQVTTDYELPGELLLVLREACRTADLIDQLHGDLQLAEGVERRRIAAEVRAQRLVLARLIHNLRLPDDDAPAGPGGIG